MPKKLAISIIVLIALLLPLIIPVGTAFAATDTSPSCTNQKPADWGNLFNGVVMTGGALFLLNFTTSFLADPPSGGASVLGTGVEIDVGGVLEPLDEVVDKLFDKWMWVVGLGIIGTLAVHITALLVDYGLILNASLGADNAVLLTGYNIILGLVNLGFVIAIIIIAFATMFRRAGWDIKSSLIKLVIAAALINFSLFFGLQVSNFSNKLTEVMLGDICPGNSLASTFNFNRTYDVIEKTLDSSNNTKGSLGRSLTEKGLDVLYDVLDEIPIDIVALFFGAILTIVGAATLLGLFLFLMARYVMVIILLVFMPFIWLSFIFPKLNVPGIGDISWSGWWGKYLKWNLNGPLIAFFLYLTALMSNYLNDPKTIASVAGQGPISGLAQILIVIAFSLGGLYMANKLGIAGASMIYGGMAKVGKTGLARLKASGIRMAGAPLRTERAKKIMGQLAGGKVVIPGTKLTIPGTKDIGRLGIRAEAYGRKQAEAEVNKYSGLTSEQKKQVLSGLPPGAMHAKIMKELMDKGELENPEQYITRKIKSGFKRSGHESVYKALEQYAVATIESIEAMAKGDVDEAAKIVQKEILALAKPGDIGKKIKLSGAFSQLNRNKYKTEEAYNEAVRKANTKARLITRALILDSPENIRATFKSLAPGAEKIAFSAAVNDTHSALTGTPSVVIPERVKEFFTASPAKKVIEGGTISGWEKLSKDVYSESEKETLSRDDLRAIIKEDKG